MSRENLTNSQQSIYRRNNNLFRNNKKQSTYVNMFCQDFCSDFSIRLGRNRYYDFYKIKSTNHKLKDLLEYDDYMFLEYNLDKLLNDNLCDLMHSGQSYTEVIRWYDENEKLVKISFSPFRNDFQFHIGNDYYYITKSSNGKMVKGKFNEKDVIKMNIKDIGFSKRYFRKLFKNIAKSDILSNDTIFNKNYDFQYDKRRKEFNLLKSCRDVRWFGRSDDHYFISKPYFAFIKKEEVILREQILKYLLGKYNDKLKQIGSIYHFDGEIYFETRTAELQELYTELETGQKTCDDFIKAIYTNDIK